MNKKIAVLAFALFAGSTAQINAMGQRDGGGGDSYRDNNSRDSSSSGASFTQRQQMILAVLRNTFSESSKRDSLKFSNTGNVYLDLWRNTPEEGGPSLANVKDYCSDRLHDSYISGPANKHRQDALNLAINIVGARHLFLGGGGLNLHSYIKSNVESSDEAKLFKAQQEAEASIRAAEARVAAQIQAQRVPVQTQARTQEEEFAIAMRVLEKSKELQDYAAALAAARK